MILVEPEYLPSVNYFKIFSNNEITINYDVKFSDNHVKLFLAPLALYH